VTSFQIAKMNYNTGRKLERKRIMAILDKLDEEVETVKDIPVKVALLLMLGKLEREIEKE
jgi:hypothetical protein